MEFSTGDAKIWYDAGSATVFLEGTFRLSSDDYATMTKVFEDVLATNPKELLLDLTNLEFLNSSGINVIARFTIAVRNGGTVALSVRGSKKIPWQGKSLPNLKKLYPAITLTIE